jgi:DNA modification methylase
MNRCFIGDCRDTMRQLIQGGVRVQTCVTSPPYFGLRDYGVDGQIGLEETPDQFVSTMVEVFDLVRELLSDDGTLWLNLGDSYSHGGNGARDGARWPKQSRNDHRVEHANKSTGTKPKDLLGIPWRVAFALQSAGWYLRQDIIWHKPNPMPESVRDRCTKAHEYIFLLSKSERYHFDAAAIAEPRSSSNSAGVAGWASGPGGHDAISHNRDKGNAKTFRGGQYVNSNKFSNSHATERDSRVNKEADSTVRNRRSVWTIATQAYSEAHFATYPPELVEPCILAGSRVGDVVFDPFFGSGTTGEVAQRLGRQWIGCELNPEYEKLQQQRTAQAGMPL